MRLLTGVVLLFVDPTALRAAHQAVVAPAARDSAAVVGVAAAAVGAAEEAESPSGVVTEGRAMAGAEEGMGGPTGGKATARLAPLVGTFPTTVAALTVLHCTSLALPPTLFPTFPALCLHTNIFLLSPSAPFTSPPRPSFSGPPAGQVSGS